MRASWTFVIHFHHILLVTKEWVALDFGLEEIDFSLESVKYYGRGKTAIGKKIRAAAETRKGD